MDVLFKILAIIVCFFILGNAYAIKRVIGTWFFPGTLFSLFWFAFLFFPLILLWGEPVNILSILFIVFCVILFSWSSVFFDWNRAYVLNKEKVGASFGYNTKLMRRSQNAFVIISIVSVIFQVLAQGILLEDIFYHPLITAGRYAKLRYAEELIKTNYEMFSLLFSLLSASLGGLIYGAIDNSKKRFITLLKSFVPSFLIMFTQGAKGLFFLTIFLFLGGVMVTLFHKKELLLFKYKTIKRTVKIFILLLGFLCYSLISRGLQYVSDWNYIYNKLIDKVGSYTLTHVYGFSDWFSAYLGMESKLEYNIQNNFYGFYTFNFIAKKFVDKEKLVVGTYDEYFFIDGMVSNIYTIFRGLIMDFGLIGAIVFMFINGLIIHFIFYLFLINKRPTFTAAIVIYMLAYFYMTFLISLLTWNVTVASFIGLLFILIVNKYKFVVKKVNFE